jgi:hypothetical protein
VTVAFNLVRVVSLLALGAHFSLTFAYLMPPNPFKDSLQPVIDATIGTYFPQNWNLFAPSPRARELKLLARPLTAAEHEAVPTAGLPSDGWYDLSAPLHRAFAANRLAAYERVSRPAKQALEDYLYAPVGLPPPEVCQRDPGFCARQERRMQVGREANAFVLTRIASAFYRDIVQDIARPEDQATHIALRVREVQPVPWPERYTAEASWRDLELGVVPFDPSATAMGLYRRPEVE